MLRVVGAAPRAPSKVPHPHPPPSHTPPVPPPLRAGPKGQHRRKRCGKLGPLPPTRTHDLEQVQSTRLVHVSPCASPGKGRGEPSRAAREKPGRTGRSPPPLPTCYSQAEKNGSRRARERRKGAGSPAPGEKWVANGEGKRRWPRDPGDRGSGGAERNGGRRPGGSQRKKAPRSRYLCSKRPRGSRVVQQFHLDLLRHRRRRCGRRLGHVALDHWQKVRLKKASGQPLAAGPLLLLAPAPQLFGDRQGLGPCRSAQRPAALQGLALSARDRAGPLCKAGRVEPEGGGSGTRLGGRGEGLLPWCSGAGGETRTAGSGEGPHQEGGSSGSTSQGEARRKARVTSNRHAEKFLAGGAGLVGSDPAAARRRGTRVGKFSKPRKPGLAPGR